MQRLSYFAFGVGLGCLFVYFGLIKGRDFPAWFPQGRVIEMICEDTIAIGPGISLPYADSLLKEHVREAEVIFNRSQVKKNPCREYQLEYGEEQMRFRICDRQATLIEYRP